VQNRCENQASYTSYTALGNRCCVSRAWDVSPLSRSFRGRFPTVNPGKRHRRLSPAVRELSSTAASADVNKLG
jgi:hypothetical protein